jgi:hypothetical protein
MPFIVIATTSFDIQVLFIPYQALRAGHNNVSYPSFECELRGMRRYFREVDLRYTNSFEGFIRLIIQQ